MQASGRCVIFSTLSPDLAFLLKRAFAGHTSTQVWQAWQISSPRVQRPAKGFSTVMAFTGHTAAHQPQCTQQSESICVFPTSFRLPSGEISLVTSIQPSGQISSQSPQWTQLSLTDVDFIALEI